MTTIILHPRMACAITLPAGAPATPLPAPLPVTPHPLTILQVICGLLLSVPGAMPLAMLSLPAPVTAPQPQTPTQPPLATDSREEEMPEEEEEPLTPTLAPCRKGKAKARPALLPPQPMCKSTCTSKLSFYVT